MTQEVNQLVEVLKSTVKELLNKGATVEQAFKCVSKLFPDAETGKTIARMIFCDLALDNGMTEETRKYLNSFTVTQEA